MLIHRDHQLGQRELEPLGGAFHDADVGLVGNEPVNVDLGTAGTLQRGAGGFFQHAHRQFEHGLAVHAQQRTAQDLTATHRAWHAKNVDMAAVGVQVGGQDAGRVRRLEHHRASAVAKQNAGGAVIEIDDARKDLCAHDQRLARRAGLDHGVGHGERVDKAAAHGLHIEGRATRQRALGAHELAELSLQDRR